MKYIVNDSQTLNMPWYETVICKLTDFYNDRRQSEGVLANAVCSVWLFFVEKRGAYER